jgi:hypothetical protein
MATIDDDGTPVIYYDPDFVSHFSEPMQRFITAHECAHHSLGHTWGEEPDDREQDADCRAIRQLYASGGFGPTELKQVQKEMRRFGGGGPYLPGPKRARALGKCLEAANDPEPVDDPAPVSGREGGGGGSGRTAEPEEPEEDPGWPWTQPDPEVEDADRHDHGHHPGGCGGWQTSDPNDAVDRRDSTTRERASSTWTGAGRRGWRRGERRPMEAPAPLPEPERSPFSRIFARQP